MYLNHPSFAEVSRSGFVGWLYLQVKSHEWPDKAKTLTLVHQCIFSDTHEDYGGIRLCLFSLEAPGSQHHSAIGRKDGGIPQKRRFVKIGMSRKHQT